MEVIILDIKIIYKSADELVPYENNPRDNTAAIDAVAASIKEFGFKNPIIIDSDNVIVAGHTRLKAAQKLKIQSVPCVVADDLTQEQVNAFRLADNKTAELAEWDLELLNSELELIDGIDMTEFGFELDIAEEQEVVEDEFDEELPEEPQTKLGDVYQLGRHRLMCGDSTDVNSVKTLMGGYKADLLLTDPPYNVDYSSKTFGRDKNSTTRKHNAIENDKMSSDDFKEFLIKVFSSSKENLKLGAAFYIWFADSEVVNFVSAANESGLSVREHLVWEKNHFVLGRQDYQHKHEPCLYGWVEGGSHAWYSDRKQTTVLNFDKPLNSQLHPTMKPVALFDYQIKNSTKSGDIVLDLFGGSGTTIIACEQNGRNAYVMEFDPRYVDVIIKRWEEFTGEKAVKLN